MDDDTDPEGPRPPTDHEERSERGEVLLHGYLDASEEFIIQDLARVFGTKFRMQVVRIAIKWCHQQIRATRAAEAGAGNALNQMSLPLFALRGRTPPPATSSSTRSSPRTSPEAFDHPLGKPPETQVETHVEIEGPPKASTTWTRSSMTDPAGPEEPQAVEAIAPAPPLTSSPTVLPAFCVGDRVEATEKNVFAGATGVVSRVGRKVMYVTFDPGMFKFESDRVRMLAYDEVRLIPKAAPPATSSSTRSSGEDLSARTSTNALERAVAATSMPALEVRTAPGGPAGGWDKAVLDWTRAQARTRSRKDYEKGVQAAASLPEAVHAKFEKALADYAGLPSEQLGPYMREYALTWAQNLWSEWAQGPYRPTDPSIGAPAPPKAKAPRPRPHSNAANEDLRRRAYALGVDFGQTCAVSTDQRDPTPEEHESLLKILDKLLVDGGRRKALTTDPNLLRVAPNDDLYWTELKHGFDSGIHAAFHAHKNRKAKAKKGRKA